MPDGPEQPPPAAGLVERLRAVHLQMVDAVLGGDGLPRVAELAAEAARAPVAIVVPRLGIATGAPARRADGRVLADIGATSPTGWRDRPAQVPSGCVAEIPIGSPDEPVGAVVLLEDGTDRSRRKPPSSCTSRRSPR